MRGGAGYGRWIRAFLLLCGILYQLSDTGLAEASDTAAPGAGPSPMVIKSKSLELDDQKKEVTFRGSVHATRDDFEIDCDQMLVRYDASSKASGEDMAGARIKEIVATGRVVIRRVQGGVATAERAVFFQGDEKVVLTGKPVVKQGNDLVEGEKITIFLKENRSVVEGSQDSQVRAVIYPRNKGK